MRKRCTRGAGLFLAALYMTFGRTGAAADSQEVEALIRQGIQLRQQGQEERSLPLFEKAYRMSRSPRTAGQLGLNEMALGYWLDAEQYLGEALESPDHPWVKKNLTTLKEAFHKVQGMIGEINVTGSPADAEVWVNGKQRGRLPLAGPIRLDNGPAEVQLRASGYVTAARAVNVAGGKREQLSFALVPEVSQTVVATTKPVATPSITPAPVSTSLMSPPPVSGEPPAVAPSPQSAPAAAADGTSNKLRLAAWALGAGAVAGLVVGAVENIISLGKEDEFNDHTIPDPEGSGRQIKDCNTMNLSAACEPLKAAHDRAATLAIVGYSVGGALAVGSIVLFVLSSSDNQQSNSALACIPAPETRGVTCRLTF